METFAFTGNGNCSLFKRPVTLLHPNFEFGAMPVSVACFTCFTHVLRTKKPNLTFTWTLFLAVRNLTSKVCI